MVESLTRVAENRVCKNVEITGKVIFVQLSRHNIFGITVSASMLNDNRCETAREIMSQANSQNDIHIILKDF